jgi:segregation and condensation protein A
MQLVETGQLAVTMPHFDGPFDLLLDLIRKNEYPMENLPIATITGKFLAYVQEAESLDMDLGGEFMETASWLVLLKSKSMLPREAYMEVQKELRAAVRKYELDRETLDQTIGKLSALRSKRLRVPAAAAASARLVEESDEKPKDPTAKQVADVVRRTISRRRAKDSFSREALAATVEDQRKWVLNHTGQFPTGTAFSTDPWFKAQTTETARATLLLALLELGRTGEVVLHQRRDFGTVLLKRREKKNKGRVQETVHAHENQTMILV